MIISSVGLWLELLETALLENAGCDATDAREAGLAIISAMSSAGYAVDIPVPREVTP